MMLMTHHCQWVSIVPPPLCHVPTNVQPGSPSPRGPLRGHRGHGQLLCACSGRSLATQKGQSAQFPTPLGTWHGGGGGVPEAHAIQYSEMSPVCSKMIAEIGPPHHTPLFIRTPHLSLSVPTFLVCGRADQSALGGQEPSILPPPDSQCQAGGILWCSCCATPIVTTTYSVAMMNTMTPLTRLM